MCTTVRLTWLSIIVAISIGVLSGPLDGTYTAIPAPNVAVVEAQDPAPVEQVTVDTPESFAEFLVGLTSEARERGYSDQIVRETLEGIEPLPRVIQADRNQAELNPGFSRYLSSRLTRTMINRGRDLSRTHRTLLARIEARLGVQRRFLVAIWGLESRFGRLTGRTPVFQALATLAWEPRRAGFFRGELFDALTMVQRGHIEAGTMTGSWAGAMGQTQFMPSSYLKFAVDFDDDGRRDIWKSTPDALASIASYLKGFGWNGEQTWGREVRVTAAVKARIEETVPRRTAGCYAERNMTERRPLDEWRRLGVTLANGRPLPRAEMAAGLVDVGERMFLVYPNYDAILAYNCAHYYALSVALLADRLQ
jgi:membrane-bound lytic murein transglycosylase B